MQSMSVDAVSATINTNRNCTVEITNITSEYSLINPKVFMTSGFSFHPPQPTIRSNKSEICSFTKEDSTATGAVGVMTYDLFHTQSRTCTERMAVLFSVPFDYILFKNVLGVGMFEVTRGCDKALYKHMYDGSDFSQFTRVDAGELGIVHKAKKVFLRATMSSVGTAIIKLEIFDRINQK